MNEILILQGSPRQGGTTDTLARLFARGAMRAGAPVRLEALRRYAVRPCVGCNACARPPHACILRNEDDTEQLFALMAQAPLIVLAAPIYFYALPAQCKALIDRSQRFWASTQNARHRQPDKALSPAPVRPLLALLAAGRPRGAQLFAGSLLTLRYFAAHMGCQLTDQRLLRGLDSPEDVSRQPAVCSALEQWGEAWGQWLLAQGGSPAKGNPVPRQSTGHMAEPCPAHRRAAHTRQPAGHGAGSAADVTAGFCAAPADHPDQHRDDPAGPNACHVMDRAVGNGADTAVVRATGNNAVRHADTKCDRITGNSHTEHRTKEQTPHEP